MSLKGEGTVWVQSTPSPRNAHWPHSGLVLCSTQTVAKNSSIIIVLPMSQRSRRFCSSLAPSMGSLCIGRQWGLAGGWTHGGPRGVNCFPQFLASIPSLANTIEPFFWKKSKYRGGYHPQGSLFLLDWGHGLTRQAWPSSRAALWASAGFSITLPVCPEKSIATREFSETLRWKEKATSLLEARKSATTVQREILARNDHKDSQERVSLFHF